MGRRVDSHAEETERYRDLRGALVCLIEDWSIEGLTVPQERGQLFHGA